MTKHGVVLEDVAEPRHFSFPPPRTATAVGGGDSCRKLAAQVDLGAAVVGSWLDSMKASSPRHRLMAPLPGAADAEHDNWMERHPSALDRFDALAAAAKGKQVAVFLDYDGTLSPIVEDPDRAVMTDEMREAVRGVAARFPTAIVSGRCRDKVFSFVRLAELYYAGSHGMDIRGPTADPNHRGKAESESSVLCQPASEFLPVMEEVYAALVSQVEPSIPGVKVENNKFCLSVHFRCVEEHAWAALFEQVRAVLKDYPGLRLTQGRKVLELRPMIRWDKGKALEFLLSALGFADADDDVFPMYVGDDRTDEDAFRVLRARGHGAGILVSRFPKETSASFTLRDPAEVKEFLRKLVVVNASTS
ncbi:probable trehalose-phosphate phosphatase 9 [Miscanthus floridulus]|uniref:probable trehalose-phosphate phosphatase 9 n=1 Tax=Miscanthus floridulus TaxID=154761 RepID=UPI00345929EB